MYDCVTHILIEKELGNINFLTRWYLLKTSIFLLEHFTKWIITRYECDIYTSKYYNIYLSSVNYNMFMVVIHGYRCDLFSFSISWHVKSKRKLCCTQFMAKQWLAKILYIVAKSLS